MNYFCRRCGNQIDLKNDRVEGKYIYICYNCETPQKKKDMIDQAQKERAAQKAFEPIYHCDSCDTPIWTHEQMDTLDNCGRCEKCQEEYPFEEY